MKTSLHNLYTEMIITKVAQYLQSDWLLFKNNLIATSSDISEVLNFEYRSKKNSRPEVLAAF